MGTWRREDIPYDAMGDYSMFDFEPEKGETKCEDQDRAQETTEAKV